MFELWFSKMPVLNKKGFFPGPEESLDSFLFRVQQIEKKYPPTKIIAMMVFLTILTHCSNVSQLGCPGVLIRLD